MSPKLANSMSSNLPSTLCLGDCSRLVARLRISCRSNEIMSPCYIPEYNSLFGGQILGLKDSVYAKRFHHESNNLQHIYKILIQMGELHLYHLKISIVTTWSILIYDTH